MAKKLKPVKKDLPVLEGRSARAAGQEDFRTAGGAGMAVRRLPLAVQTLHSELLERLRVHEMERRFGHLAGAFSQKRVEGQPYWYFRTSEGAHGRTEHFIGPDTPDTQRLMASYEAHRREAQAFMEETSRMAEMLRHGGVQVADAVTSKVVQALAAAGVFRQGAVLVGTHAYMVLGNLLGVRWGAASTTQDLGLAAFRTLHIAVSRVESSANIWGTLEALEMGFLPTPRLDPKTPSTSYHIRNKELRVDFLTTGSRRGPNPPAIFLPRFQAAARPMVGMDYLIREFVPGVQVGSGAVLVNVPDPARFGLHKLVVAALRPTVELAKARKDVVQAREVLDVLMQDRPGSVELAAEALREAGLHKKARATAEAQLGVGHPVSRLLAKL